ncbi:hypothetical protein [uncultured Succinatimonas sp.]|uniref:hypothetical protein n=1 Tax=uncultured Succinatimonas sp. TaxID=1262973 RepID=UPI0025CCF111|nr:hypothetical protein [uncultured Succinatimonas sp.]
MIETEEVQNDFLGLSGSNYCILDDIESEELYEKLNGDILPNIKQRRDLLMAIEYVWNKQNKN